MWQPSSGHWTSPPRLRASSFLAEAEASATIAGSITTLCKEPSCPGSSWSRPSSLSTLLPGFDSFFAERFLLPIAIVLVTVGRPKKSTMRAFLGLRCPVMPYSLSTSRLMSSGSSSKTERSSSLASGRGGGTEPEGACKSPDVAGGLAKRDWTAVVGTSVERFVAATLMLHDGASFELSEVTGAQERDRNEEEEEKKKKKCLHMWI
jgi:hypothetical protein